MPDSFSPLEKSDLTFSRKNKKADFEKEKNSFMKWFNSEMSDNKAQTKKHYKKIKEN